MIHELNIVGMEQDELRMVRDSFSVPKSHDLTDCELISKYFKHYQANSSEVYIVQLFRRGHRCIKLQLNATGGGGKKIRVHGEKN